MRRPSIALSVTLALLMGGCDSVTSTAAKYNPFVSFEARCASLPPARIEVRQGAIDILIDDQLPYRQLTRLGEDNPATHRTLGLTKADFRQEARIETTGLSDSSGGRSCARPQIVLELTMAPMTVYVASELADNACGHSAVLEHEMKHVAAFREHLAATARTLDAEVPQLFGQQIIFARDASALEAQIRQVLQTYLHEFTARNAVQLKDRQAAVDSVEEYSRINDACGGIRVE